MPTQKEMIEQLRRGRVSLPPLSIRLLEGQPEADENVRLNAFVEVAWGERTARFALECRSLSTPKAFRDGLNRLRSAPLSKGYQPMLLVPFLHEKQLQELEQEGISGIDLCGNGVVVAPGRFAIFRRGGQNRFPSSARIKNIYRKNSSMVGRVFLACSRYAAVQEIGAEINLRNLLVHRWGKKPMRLSTVSKALKTLEEDLIIEREGVIRLVQADKLLEKLGENYVPPKIRERVGLKVSEDRGTILEQLLQQGQELGLPLVATGTSSVARYAVMPRGEVLSVYCPRSDRFLKGFSGSQSDRFPNLELFETEDETAYFDARQEQGFWWASPVQVYLELMAGDKRDRETAEQVKSYLLRDLR